MLEKQIKELKFQEETEVKGLKVTLKQELPESLGADQEADLFNEGNIISVTDGKYTLNTEMANGQYYTYVVANNEPEKTIHMFLPENYFILEEIKEVINNFSSFLEDALQEQNEGEF